MSRRDLLVFRGVGAEAPVEVALRGACSPRSRPRQRNGLGLRVALLASLSLTGCFDDPAEGDGSATGGVLDSTGSTGSTDTQSPTTDTDPTGPGCIGCLDAAGGCLAGNLDQACGALADACVVCDAQSYCDEGTCVPRPACTPESCDGCCDGDECLPGADAAACGADGEQCSRCMGSSVCNEGSCALPCADNCDGCCDASGDCIPLEATSAAACGQHGEACVTCADASQCESGFCISTECAMTCDGCCVEDDCMPGDSPNACGAEGTACFTCPAGTLCTTNCVADPEASWDVLIEYAELPRSPPEGGNWDAFGLPDAYVELTIGKEVVHTDTINGTLLPVWNEVVLGGRPTADLMVPIEYAIYDDDSPLGRELAGLCEFQLGADQFGIPLIAECTDDESNVLWTLRLSVLASD